MIRIVVLAVLWWWAFGQAIVYGGIWQTQHAPAADVEVQSQSGYVERGALSRGWDRRWILVRADGSQVFFLPNAAVSIRVPARAQVPSYQSLWREWVPPVAVTMIFIAAVLWPGSFRQRMALQ